MRGRAAGLALALVATIAAGCLSSPPVPSPNEDEAPPPAAAEAPVEVYVVATDFAANPDYAFKFRRDRYDVAHGATVNLTLSGALGNMWSHTLVLPAFQVRLGPVGSGAQATAQLTADRSGTFPFYCDVTAHRDLGMRGTLTIA
jgi:plastocyanin